MPSFSARCSSSGRVSAIRLRCRFLRSCWSSSIGRLIVEISWGWVERQRQLEVRGGDAAQDHVLEAAEVVEAVVRRGLDGGEQGLAGILAGHAQKLAQGQRRLQLAAALEGVEVGLDVRQQAAQVFLLRERVALVPPALATGRAMLGPEHVAAARLGLAVMRSDFARSRVDDDTVLRLAHLEAAADERGGHGVVVGIEGDVALDIDEPLMKQVGLGDPAGQAAQGRMLGGEELARGGLELALGAGVDAVTTRPRLA